MKLNRKLFLTLAAAAAYCVCTVAASAITILQFRMETRLSIGQSQYDAQFFSPPSPLDQLFNSTQNTAAVHGEYYSKLQTSISGIGNEVTLQSSTDQKRPGGSLSPGPYAYTRVYGEIVFTVDANSTYELSGSFSASDVLSPGGVHLSNWLRDITTGAYVSRSEISSYFTANESLSLGSGGGDYNNQNIGSLSGVLIQGHMYQWVYSAITESYPDADSGTHATGFLRLDINGGAPPPPPPPPPPPISVPDQGTTSFALLALSLGGVFALRRKFRLAA